MANTLTALVPTMFQGMRTVSREMVGFIPAVGRNSTAERAALNQSVTFPITPRANGVNITPAMQVPEPTDQTVTAGTITITKSRAYEFGFVGEEKLLLDGGGNYAQVQADMFAEALRSITNEMETDVAVAAAAAASRAAGTAGTTPFATNTAGVSLARKILVDNGSPQSDMQLVLDSTAGANLRTLSGINTDRDWSDRPIREQGVLLSPHGVDIRESGQGQSHTAGNAASATTDTAGYAVGATTITLASAGTGAILIGDVVSFAGDTEQYVVKTGDADVSGGGQIVLQSPGLRQAIPASATAITVKADHASNVIFHRNAMQLATRAPALPKEGDVALSRRMMTDPRSGISFEVSIYPGYRKNRYEVAAAWGVGAVQEDHIGLLLG